MKSLARSALLGLHLPAPERVRPWWMRRIAMFLISSPVVLLALVVAYEVLPQRGLGWFLYALHDRLWLPLRAFVWTRAGVWSLLWFVPVLFLALLVLIEFLGVAQPLRRMQIAVLRWFLRSRFSHLLLALQQRLGWRGGHEGQLVAVLESELSRQEAVLKEAAESGQKADSRELTRSVVQMAYLRAEEPSAQLRCAEGLMLIARHAEADHVTLLRKKLRQIWPEADGARIEAVLHCDPAQPEPLFILLREASGTGADLALATLAMARPEALSRADLVRAWFTEWARMRHDPQFNCHTLSDAERLVDFEFWAARAEFGLVAHEVGGDRSGWLGDLLPSVTMRRSMGELAAVGLDVTAHESRGKAGR